MILFQDSKKHFFFLVRVITHWLMRPVQLLWVETKGRCREF